MQVAFRTDGAPFMGGGHVMRCLALAEELQSRGAECCFLCRSVTDRLAARITQAGHRLVRLSGEPSTDSFDEPRDAIASDDPPHKRWLGTDWALDAKQSAAALQSVKWDWIVVDHYALDSRWHSAIRQATARQGSKLLVIDDLGDRALDCDVLLDPNFRFDGRDPFRGRLPDRCTRFEGPSMALLEAGYRDAHQRAKPRDQLNHVLIYLGNTPVEYLTRCLDALIPANLTADVVVPTRMLHDARLTHHATVLHEHVIVHGPVPSLLPMMQRADLAIGPIGSSTWERFCVGLPTIAVTMAVNQKTVAHDLHAAGLIDLLGPVHDVSVEDYISALNCMGQPDRLRHLSSKGMDVCDGRGAERLADCLMAGQSNR